jgi:GTP-binding protein HflX
LLTPPNQALLVIVDTYRQSNSFREESFREMKELTVSAASRVAGHVFARVDSPSPGFFVREGKLNEIFLRARACAANALFFNVNLTPVQTRNIERVTRLRPLDRTGLILEIFGRRAQSREGKLQVELAQLNYALPRLGGLGVVLSRMGGGIGTRGPGEQMLEADRRKIRNRIRRVREELERVREHRERIRSGRRKKHYHTVAFVGYTNAGKSTLLNALTGADTYVADQLFATLDPKTRLQTLDGRRDVLFIDTVGLIRDLPHGLVEAFHATLEEVTEADALIHVLDASSSCAHELKSAVEKVLEEIHASQKPRVLVLNKADLLDETARQLVLRDWPEGILISAKQKLGLHSLLAKLDSFLPSEAAGEFRSHF